MNVKTAPSGNATGQSPQEASMIARFPYGEALVQLPSDDTAPPGAKPERHRHRLHELPQFGDDALVKLLDTYPRERIQVFTMGSDPTRSDEWALVDKGDASGADLLQAVHKGRIWINVVRAQAPESPLAELVQRLYREIVEQRPAFRPDGITSTLLISSPQAQVYYHVDGPANFLWHIRGRKRLYVYPPTPPYLSKERLEDIFANVVGEEMQYDPAWDRDAVVMELDPGEWAAWPHNSPHRVENLGTLNVSLTTNHVTPQNIRRSHVYLANRYLRRQWGVRSTSTRDVGAASACKSFAYRVFRRLGLDDVKSTFAYTPRYRIDLDAPNALMSLGG